MNSDLHVAILAAGRAVRFGGEKLDIPIADKRLGRWALDSALALDPPHLVIIVPQTVPEFARNAEEAGLATLLVNANAEFGLSTSIALAAKNAAATGSGSLLLMLADMPLVTADTLRRLAAAVAPGRPAAVRHADGGAGIPACFPRDFFDSLQSLEGDRGAAALLRSATDVQLVEVVAAELLDVDRATDIELVVQALDASLHRR